MCTIKAVGQINKKIRNAENRERPHININDTKGSEIG